MSKWFKVSMTTLIAMWLWCVGAAGENIPLVVTPEMLQQSGHTATLQAPCNWDKNLDNVQVVGFYGDKASGLRELPLEPISKQVVGTFVQVSFDPESYRREELELHHANVMIATTEKTCPGGFGFDPGNFVK